MELKSFSSPQTDVCSSLKDQTRGPSITAGYERTGAAGLGEGSIAATAAAAAPATSQLLSAAVSVQAMTSPKGSKVDVLSIPMCHTCSEPVLTNARTDQRSESLKQTLTAAMRKPAVAALRLSQVLPPHSYTSQHSQHAVCSGPAGAAAAVAAGGGDGGGSDEPHSAAVPRSEHMLDASSAVRAILQGSIGTNTAAGTAAGTITSRAAAAAAAGAGQLAWTRLSVEVTDDDDIVRLGSCSSSSYWASAAAAAADSYSTLPGTAGWHTSLDVTHSSSSFDIDIGSSTGDNSNGHCSMVVLPVQLTPLQLPATTLQGACLGSTLHAWDAHLCTTTARHQRCHSCDVTTCRCQQLSILSSTVLHVADSKSATLQGTFGSAVAAVAAALQHAHPKHAECTPPVSTLDSSLDNSVDDRLAIAATVRDQDNPSAAHSTSPKVVDAVCTPHAAISDLQCATQPVPGTLAASGVELRVHTHHMLASLEAVSPVAAAAPRALPTQPELGTSWDRSWTAPRLAADMPSLAYSLCGTGGVSAIGCGRHASRTDLGQHKAGMSGMVPGAVGAACSKQWPARRMRYGAASLACEPGRQHTTARLSVSGAKGSTGKPLVLPVTGSPKGCTAATGTAEVEAHELQAPVAAQESEKAGIVSQLSEMVDIDPGQQKELDQAEQQQTECKKRCQELELQLIEAHFDRGELEGLLGAQAASAQQQANAQAAKHKQQVDALQQQVQDLLQLLSQAGCVHSLQLNPVRDALPKPVPARGRDVWRQGGKAVGSQHSAAGRRPSALVRQSSGQHSMGPMTAARQRQDQHAKACAGMVGIGGKQHSCLAGHAGAGAGAGSQFVHRPASASPAGDLLPPVQTVTGAAAAAAVRRTAHTTAATQHEHATVLSAQRKNSSTAGGSTPEAWYPGGVSQGLLRTPANSSSGACRSTSSSSSTSSQSSYKSSHSCFSR